jgi:hypothetical protein
MQTQKQKALEIIKKRLEDAVKEEIEKHGNPYRDFDERVIKVQ